MQTRVIDMAARLVSPSRREILTLRTPLNSGEQRVLDFFDRLLPVEWEIYVQPHLNGLRPDFVLLHPYVGIAVFEVKDWDLDVMHYEVRSRDSRPPILIARDRNGKQFRHRDNPVDKIREYKQAILELYCPRLRVRANQDRSVVALVTAGIIMTRASTQRAEELLSLSLNHYGMRGDQSQYYPVSGGDALDGGQLASVFPESLRSFSRYMDPQLADDLRSWLIEPDFASTQRQPLHLDVRQRGLVRSRTETGYRRIKGPAGSGKSLVLAARAAELSAANRDVLVVTYNQTLWHYLRDLAVRHQVPGRRLNDRVTWCHFHDWCKRVCFEAGFEDEYRALWTGLPRDTRDEVLPESLDETLEQRLLALVSRALSDGGEQVTRYDALLVDEGQDFNLEWWNVLRRAIRPGGEYLLVADETQDLYDRTKHWTYARMAGAGFRGDWRRLTTSYRLPPVLIPLLRDFVARYLPNHAASPLEAEQLALTLYPVQLRWFQVHAATAAEACAEAVASLPASATNSLAFPDITLLVESHEFGLRCVELLGQKGIRCAHVFGASWQEQRRNKRAFYMGDARVKASTIHSFKGWETRAIVVYLGSARDQRALASAYVGLSRLKRHEQESLLTVICAAPELEAYGRTWPCFEKR
jgi:hypothetical protein